MSLLLEQLMTFFMLVGAGAVMGLVFDIYRVSRWLLKLPKFLVHFFDLVIWIIFAISVFLILILGNWGEVRLYVFIGLIIGLVLYFRFFSSSVIKALLSLYRGIKRMVKVLIKIFTVPIKLIGAVLIVPIGIISFCLKKVILSPIKWVVSKIVKPLKKLQNKIKNKVLSLKK